MYINKEDILNRETTTNMFMAAYRNLGIAALLLKCNIIKGCGIGVSSIFTALLLLVFTGKNLYVAMNSRYSFDFEGKKDAYYRFIKDPHFNWGKFILQLAIKVIAVCNDCCTGVKRPCFFVMDDSIIKKDRSNKVELLSRMFDHVSGKSHKCFNLLMLGWTDGYTFLPVQFLMMCSKHILKEALEKDWDTDPRTCAGRTKEMAQWEKRKVAVYMVQKALEAGINVTALLVDTWFTNEPFIHDMQAIGMDTIGMLKDINQRYLLNGRFYDLKGIFNKAWARRKGDIIGSIIVQTKFYRIPVKIVFVVNRNKKSEWIAILSTNIDLTDEQIIEYYGNRWSIECCYKVMKGFLGLGKEFQTQTYAATICSTAISLTRYIILEYLHRINTDGRTLNEYCRDMCDEVPRIDFDEALRNLLSLVTAVVKKYSDSPVAVELRAGVFLWYIGLPKKVQDILPELDFEVDCGKALIPIPDCEDEVA